MTFVHVIYLLMLLAGFSKSLQDPVKYFEEITRNYFSGESVLFIYWSNKAVDLASRSRRLLPEEKCITFHEKLLKYWVTSEIVSFETCNCDHVTDDIILRKSYVKNTVVLFGDVERDIRNMRQCLSWNSQSKILAVVNDNDYVTRTLEKIWTLTKAMNVTVMVVETSSVRYYTSYPYENFKIVELDQNKLFPSKPLNDLHGSIVTAAVTDVEPYVFVSETPNVFTEGLEIRIVNFLANHYNFKIKYLQPPNGESPWIVLSSDNRKVVGNIGLAYRYEADLLCHGLQVTPGRYSLADLSVVHTFDNFIWAVPVRPYTFNWRSIIVIFQNDLWALLFATLILISVTLYIIVKYEPNSAATSYNIYDALFQSFGIYLYVPIYFYRKSQLYRLFIFTLSYFTVIVVSLYQSCLITYLTARGSGDQYGTIEEVVDAGLIGYFYPSSKPSFNLTDHDLWNKILAPGRHVYSENKARSLELAAYNKTNYALLMNTVVNFEVHKNLLGKNHEPMVRVLPNKFLPYLVSIFTSKGHPLRDLVKIKTMELFERGILTHWSSEILLKNIKNDEGDTSTNDEGPVALSVDHLRGAFYIIPFLCTIAGVVLVCEVVYYRWTVRKVKKLRFNVQIWDVSEVVVYTRDKWILKREVEDSNRLSLGLYGKRRNS